MNLRADTSTFWGVSRLYVMNVQNVIDNIMYPKRYYDSYIMYTQIVIDNPKMSLRLSHRRQVSL